MVGRRVKQFRLARGWSLQDLVDNAGKIVTKQAVSKIEKGRSSPTNKVLRELARALAIPVSALLSQPEYSVEFIAFRKGSRMTKTDQESIKSTVEIELRDRVRLYGLLSPDMVERVPYGKYPVCDIDGIENAAEKLRNEWSLGSNPIPNVTDLLEEHGIHVVTVRLPEETRFDGVSARVLDADGGVLAAGVVSRIGVDGERQRLNLAHELGHIVLAIEPQLPTRLNMPAAKAEEKAAFRFAGAF